MLKWCLGLDIGKYFPVEVIRKSKLIFAFLCIAQFTVNAQFYEIGQDPSSIRWKQIKLKNYKLIFPSDFEPAAKNFAATLDTFYASSSRFLDKKHKPVSIIFHTQSSLSNGMVVYAPKRMELFTIPPQDNDPQDWLDQLALHETRHVAQLDALNQGITKLGSYLIGQQAIGAVSGLVPRWFFEGDAVYSETVFSNAGRGRNAAFAMPYRALTLSHKKLYSYEKALLGSYRNYVPDVYQMGYPMVKMMRDSFGSDIFAKSLKYSARNPYVVFPFGHSLKMSSGHNNRLAYQYTYSNLRKVWEQQDSFSEYQQWPVKQTNTFTNYNLPVKIDSLLLVQKWGLSQTRSFVTINKNGKEKKLLTIGSNNSERISVYKTRLAWSENKTDLRWVNRTYSEVVVFDLVTRRKKVLTHRSWLYSPAFSANGEQIVVVEETPQYKSSLVAIDALSGNEAWRVSAPEGSHLQYPVWNGNEIYCLSVEKAGKSIIKLNAQGTWETLMPAGFKNISSFCFSDSSLVIAGEDKGVNNLFVYEPSHQAFCQITNSRFGAFEPYYDQESNTLYFSEYTSNGYRVAKTDWNPQSYPKIENYREATSPKEKIDFNLQKTKIDSSLSGSYITEGYSKLGHLFNVHSWLPVYFNYAVSSLSSPRLYPGFLIMSQNMLGTLVSTAGVSYQEGYPHMHATVSYKALYPVISWSMDAGGPVSRYGSTSTEPVPYQYNLQSTVNISLPLNFSRGRFASGLTPYVEWKLNRNAYYVNADRRYYQGQHYINYGANFYWYTKMSIRDLFPRFGISSYYKMQTTPFESKVFNHIYALSGRLYMPGLMKNHSFQFRYAYQYQLPLRYYYGSMISFPSGYSSQRTEKLHLYSFTYAMPLFYPDFNLGPVLYVKRFRAHFFYDEAHNRYHPKVNIITKDILRSVGTDLIADVHFLRIMFPFQVGARIIYHPNEKTIFSQAIFSVDLVY